MRSWAAEVIADSAGGWTRNQLRFARHTEAYEYGVCLAYRWTAVTAVRAALTADPITHKFADFQLSNIGGQTK